MSKIDEREILRRAEKLAQIETTPEATRRAVERAGKVLMASQNRKQQILKKMIVPTSIAAGILIVIGVLIISLSQKSVSAAELFKEVARLTGTYKGWIHITQDQPHEVEGISEQLRQSIGKHINTTDGTSVSVYTYKDAFWVKWLVPSSEQNILYHSKVNEIRVGRLRQTAAERLAGLSWPTTFASLVTLMESEGPDAFEIRRTKEGPYDRFDIKRSVENADPWPEAFESIAGYRRVGDQFTIWTNSVTKLVQRIEYKDDEGVVRSLMLSYGEPFLNDIYDLGVPGDAEVIERQIAAEAIVVLDRLDRRVKEGLGDYVALLTEWAVKEDGTLSRKEPNLHIYMQNGDAWLANEYRIRNVPNEMGQIAKPAGWPDINITEILTLAEQAFPYRFFIDDGTRAWQGFYGVYSQKTGSYDGLGEIRNSLSRLAFIPRESLSGEIWMGRDRLGAYRPAAKVQLITDEKRQGLIGLQSDYIYEGDPRRKTYWIDPDRDDMPVERVTPDFEEDGRTVRREWRTRYLDYAQLPNGQWYPTRWQTTFPGDGNTPEPHITEYHLQIYPDVKVDEIWFTNPAERLRITKQSEQE